MDTSPPPPTDADFETLRRAVEQSGPLVAIDELCRQARDRGDFRALFYAMLMRARVEMGVPPFPTGPAADLPAETHEPYEEAIRTAGRLAGGLHLERGEVGAAWGYYHMLGEPEPIRAFIDAYEYDPEKDVQGIIDLALGQGLRPAKGFELALKRYGICSAITMYGGQDFGRDPVAKQACIGRLVTALWEQLRDRLRTDIVERGTAAPESAGVADLLDSHPDLTAENAYHIDTSHLSSVAQISLDLDPSPAVKLARELCLYGERLGSSFQPQGEPPFEHGYSDYRLFLEVIDDFERERGLAHFRAKLAPALVEENSFPAEMLVNLLLRIGRDAEAVAVAQKYLATEERPLACPSVQELSLRSHDYAGLAAAAKRRGDGVNYLAGLIAGRAAATTT